MKGCPIPWHVALVPLTNQPNQSLTAIKEVNMPRSAVMFLVIAGLVALSAYAQHILIALNAPPGLNPGGTYEPGQIVTVTQCCMAQSVRGEVLPTSVSVNLTIACQQSEQ